MRLIRWAVVSPQNRDFKRTLWEAGHIYAVQGGAGIAAVGVVRAQRVLRCLLLPLGCATPLVRPWGRASGKCRPQCTPPDSQAPRPISPSLRPSPGPLPTDDPPQAPPVPEYQRGTDGEEKRQEWGTLPNAKARGQPFRLFRPSPNTEGVGADPKECGFMRIVVAGVPIRVSAALMNVRDREGNAFGEIKGY